MGEKALRGELGTVADRLVCQSRVLALDEKSRTVKHVVSTALIDRNNRIVDVGGWKLARYRANPVVLADHEYNLERIIGRSKSIKVEGDALVATTEFAEEGLGNVAFRLVQAGLVNSWSVGWIGLKQHAIGDLEDCPACKAALSTKKDLQYGTHFTQSELLEYSLVAIPSNPDAVMGLQAAGLVSSAEFELYTSGVEDPEEPEPEIEPDPELDIAEPNSRSREFLTCLSIANRTYARRVAARRLVAQIRSSVCPT
jgi:hypothetical protein